MQRKDVNMAIVEPIRDKKLIEKIEDSLKKTKPRDYVLFCMGVNSGLRISDILNLDVADVKDKNYLSLKEKKTGKNKIFPLNQKLKNILDFYTKNRALDEPLFLTKYKNRMDRITAYRIINNACKEINLDINIGTHTLRKTFGYHFYKKYKDVAMLQKILNHSTPRITMTYIGINDEEIWNCCEKFIL